MYYWIGDSDAIRVIGERRFVLLLHRFNVAPLRLYAIYYTSFLYFILTGVVSATLFL